MKTFALVEWIERDPFAFKPDDSLDLRLLTAWRKSGMSIGVLFVRAAQRYHSLGAFTLPELSDLDAVEMLERYVEEECR